MKKLTGSTVVVLILLSVFVFTGCGLYSYGTSGMLTNYENPQWAPPYYAGARYYYIPDIECYYDLSTTDFIYLNNGSWYFSRGIPSMYNSFDLNDCFTVVLSDNVYQPWMHHQYYASHYPRYYYRDYYDHSNFPYVRGFNENLRSAIYWSESERSRARRWDDQNIRENRNFKYTNEDHQQQRIWSNQGINKQSPNNNNNNQGNRNNGATSPNNDSRNNQNINSGNNNVNRQPQNDNNRATRTTETDNTNRQQPAKATDAVKAQETNYYGRKIGNPVKVEKQMQNRTETKSETKTKTRTETTGRR